MKVKEKDLINIDEVCTLAKLSVPTVYRRVKLNQFPKPKKVKSTAARGPKTVNRWERGDVMKWLLKSNDKAPVTKEKSARYQRNSATRSKTAAHGSFQRPATAKGRSRTTQGTVQDKHLYSPSRSSRLAGGIALVFDLELSFNRIRWRTLVVTTGDDHTITEEHND